MSFLEYNQRDRRISENNFVTEDKDQKVSGRVTGKWSQNKAQRSKEKKTKKNPFELASWRSICILVKAASAEAEATFQCTESQC